MGKKVFGTVCLILAALFTLAAVKGMVTDEFGAVLILPAMTAIALVFVAIKSRRKTADSRQLGET